MRAAVGPLSAGRMPCSVQTQQRGAASVVYPTQVPDRRDKPNPTSLTIRADMPLMAMPVLLL